MILEYSEKGIVFFPDPYLVGTPADFGLKYDDVSFEALLESPQRTFHHDFTRGQRHIDACWHYYGIIAYSRHVCLGLFRYATIHSTSPPIPVARALRSVITTLGVEIMAIPKPFITLGRSRLAL